MPIQRLIHAAGSYEEGAAKPDTVKSHIYGRRPVSLAVMRQVAEVLKVKADQEFAEYADLVQLEEIEARRRAAVGAAEEAARRRRGKPPGDASSRGSSQA